MCSGNERTWSSLRVLHFNAVQFLRRLCFQIEQMLLILRTQKKLNKKQSCNVAQLDFISFSNYLDKAAGAKDLFHNHGGRFPN